jgi:hypothetical protein
MSAVELRDLGELDKALSVDQHGIEPIPDGDRDSTAWQQFWIWFGANVIPTSWVVGAIGRQLGLSLVQSIVIMVVGQAAGALIFGVFILMGKRTGVSQFALGRMAFGRRGNNIPSIINGLIILAWTGLNTYIVLSLATYCLHTLGLPNNRTTEYSVAALIMIIQLIIGTLGFYAIRSFEKWTAPVLAAVMAVMTVLAFSKRHVVWNHSTVHGAGLIAAASGLMTAVGIGWGFSWSPWASDYSRFTRPEVPEKRLYWANGDACRLLARPRMPQQAVVGSPAAQGEWITEGCRTGRQRAGRGSPIDSATPTSCDRRHILALECGTVATSPAVSPGSPDDGQRGQVQPVKRSDRLCDAIPNDDIADQAARPAEVLNRTLRGYFVEMSPVG